MAKTPKYKLKKGQTRTADEYKEIQAQIDALQMYRSRLGVAKSVKARLSKGNKSQTQYQKDLKPVTKPKIYNIERFARE